MKTQSRGFPTLHSAFDPFRKTFWRPTPPQRWPFFCYVSNVLHVLHDITTGIALSDRRPRELQRFGLLTRDGVSPGQRAGRTVAVPRHGHERPDAVGRLFLDGRRGGGRGARYRGGGGGGDGDGGGGLVVFRLRGPGERGHGTPVAGHGLGRAAARRRGRRRVVRERPAPVVPGQQQPQPGVQRVRVAAPQVRRGRSAAGLGAGLVVCAGTHATQTRRFRIHGVSGSSMKNNGGQTVRGGGDKNVQNKTHRRWLIQRKRRSTGCTGLKRRYIR